MKTCPRCKENKTLLGFNKDKSRKDGLAPICKLCNAKSCTKYSKANNYKSQKKHHQKNKDKYKVYFQKWRKENSEKAKEYSKKYRRENSEKTNARDKKYHKEHPEKSRARSARYRARKRKAHIAPVNFQEIFIRDKGKCHICKKLVDPDNWHLDHILSLFQGGTHEPKNVAVSHPKCNMQKGAFGVV